MTSPSPLERLAGPGNVLAKEPPDAKEFAGLVRSGLARLKDAENESNSLESRFDLAYGGAHALCLATLRHHGFRPSSGTSFLKYCRTLLVWARRCGASCRSATTCGIGPSTRVPSTLTTGSSRIWSAPVAGLRTRSADCRRFRRVKVRPTRILAQGSIARPRLTFFDRQAREAANAMSLVIAAVTSPVSFALR